MPAQAHRTGGHRCLTVSALGSQPPHLSPHRTPRSADQRLGCGIQSPIDVGLEGKSSSSGMARPSHSCEMEGAGCVLWLLLGIGCCQAGWAPHPRDALSPISPALCPPRAAGLNPGEELSRQLGLHCAFPRPTFLVSQATGAPAQAVPGLPDRVVKVRAEVPAKVRARCPGEPCG